MKVDGTAFANVADMVRDTCDAAFSEEFDEHLAEHGLSKVLTVLRCGQGQTQREIGEKMGCGQAKVSKMERTPDRGLNLGDVVDYSRALGRVLHVVLTPATANAADHIRFHVNSIKQELERMVELSGDDRATRDGVEAYALDNVAKYMAMIEDAVNRLPRRPQQIRSSLCLQVEGEWAEGLAPDPRKRVRKSPAKADPST